MVWLFVIAPIAAILLAVLFGALQLGGYRLLQRSGLIAADDHPPFFGIFVFRGLLVVLFGIAVMAIWAKQGVAFWEDPLLTEEAQQGYREVLDPELHEERRKEAERAFNEREAAKEVEAPKELPEDSGQSNDD